jgi:DNA-binding MarR family transcriptional regulator
MPPASRDAVSGADLAAIGDILDELGSWIRRVTPRDDLNAVTLSTLAALVRHGPRRVTDLVARERISQPGMTGVVARLADAGLVERQADPRDGRASLIAATQAGHAYIRSIHAKRARLLVEHVGELRTEQQRALRAAVPALQALAGRTVSTESQS